MRNVGFLSNVSTCGCWLDVLGCALPTVLAAEDEDAEAREAAVTVVTGLGMVMTGLGWLLTPPMASELCEVAICEGLLLVLEAVEEKSRAEEARMLRSLLLARL